MFIDQNRFSLVKLLATNSSWIYLLKVALSANMDFSLASLKFSKPILYSIRLTVCTVCRSYNAIFFRRKAYWFIIVEVKKESEKRHPSKPQQNWRRNIRKYHMSKKEKKRTKTGWLVSSCELRPSVCHKEKRAKLRGRRVEGKWALN